jgi:1-deoxy-D-xylulose-5-phosphate reductoisomerase
VVRRWPERFRVFALVAGQNVELLASQIQEFRPEVAVVASSDAEDRLAATLSATGLPSAEWPQILSGGDARVGVAKAPETDIVLSAIVGVAGLEATYEAVRSRKIIALANKETLVAGGELVMRAAREHGTSIIPVDSEHNGAHQCLRGGLREEAVKLILTASGGPFRNTPIGELETVTPEQALKHPTWRMGPRITIDSATLMNKGFEVIEACWLFEFQPQDVEVVVHPQSSVHAMVEFRDGSVLAQVCATDMRMPIQYALMYPERADAPVPRLNWYECRQWDFFPPDLDKFPLLRLAYEAQEAQNSATCTLNAADEVAVEAFLSGLISFPAIAAVVADTLDRVPACTPRSVQDVLEIDIQSRHAARECVRSRATIRV